MLADAEHVSEYSKTSIFCSLESMMLSFHLTIRALLSPLLATILGHFGQRFEGIQTINMSQFIDLFQVLTD